MIAQALRYVVVEGLPAAGKSEALELLARFYPRSIRVLPELVKSVVERDRIDLFTNRDALTRALMVELPRRRRRVQEILDAGFLCLEESHLGVHRAYSSALGDHGFLDAYDRCGDEGPVPDAYVHFDLSVAESVARQAARGTPQYDIAPSTLELVLAELAKWHSQHGVRLISLDADRSASALIADLEDLLGLSYGKGRVAFAKTFDLLLLLGRPAGGKSEFIDFMSRQRVEQRATDYHLAPFSVIDDFPVLWQKFEEDDVWESQGRPRLYSQRSDGNYAVTDDGIWAFLIERINAAAAPRLVGANEGRSLIVEFSRGGSTGYANALAGLSDAILSRAAILYVSVSFEESWRRNVARYDEKRRSGILTHSVPREEMQRTYGTDDWEKLTGGRPSGTIEVRGQAIPFVTMSNEPESVDPSLLGHRYGHALRDLFDIRSQAADSA